MVELFSVNKSQYFSKRSELKENTNNIPSKINNNSQDSSDSLNFRDEIKEKSDQLNCNYASQKYSPSENTMTQDSINVSKPNSFILMDIIRSCLREDGEILQFFKKSIYPRFIEMYKKRKESDPVSVVDDFMHFSIPTFFGKISGNPYQKVLNFDEDFSSKTEFLISRTSPEEVRNDCLAVVRTLMDFSFSEQITDKYGVNQEYLTRMAKQYFWGSRKFLQDQAIEQIPEFAEHLKTGVESFDFEKIEIDFNDNFKATVELKKDGIEFGEILSLKKGDETITRYFIKGFTGYLVKNHTRGSLDIWLSDEIIEEEDCFKPLYYRCPNIREPFAYKLLECFGMGPHVEFIINPYISRGFYIATRDLTYENQIFMELGYEIFHRHHYDCDKLFYSFTPKFPKQRSEELHINITKLDIIIRIMLLTDIHKGNIGFVLKGCNDFSLNDFLNENVKLLPYIIDFRAHKISPRFDCRGFLYGAIDLNYQGRSIITDVLLNKSKEEKYYMGFKAIQSIQECLRNLVPLENQDDSENADEIRLKILLKEKANEIKSLFLQRRNDLPVLRNRMNAELIGFEIKSSSGEHSKEKKYVSFIEDAFDNLDQYCEEIIINYQTLKNYIIDGYNNYYDEEGKLKIQSVSSSV